MFHNAERASCRDFRDASSLVNQRPTSPTQWGFFYGVFMAKKLKHFSAERAVFSGGTQAIIFRSERTAFGTVIDEYDNCFGAVLIEFNASGQRSGEVFITRLGANGLRESDYMVSCTPCEVQAREVAYTMPKTLAKTAECRWKFGSVFLKTTLQFQYEY